MYGNILFDKKWGARKYTYDMKFIGFLRARMKTYNFEMLEDSYNRSLSDAFEEIETKRPDVLEKATPTKFNGEIKRLIKKI